MNSRDSLKISQDESGRAIILGVPIQKIGGDRIKLKENIYDLTPEIYKVSSFTAYTGENMKNEKDILMMNKIIRDLNFTGD